MSLTLNQQFSPSYNDDREYVELKDVEYFCWVRDPAWTMSPDDLEWLMMNERKLQSSLLRCAKDKTSNNRIRVWFQQDHKLVFCTEEDKEALRDKLGKKFDLRDVFASTYSCRLCGIKLWSGLTRSRGRTEAIEAVLRSHGATHIIDCIEADARRASETE